MSEHDMPELGLELCNFTAERPLDCDLCRNAKPGSQVYVRMMGASEGRSVEAYYYACTECAEQMREKQRQAEFEQDEPAPAE